MFGIVTPGGCEQMFIYRAVPSRHPEKIAAIEASYGIENDETIALAMTLPETDAPASDD